MVEPCPRVLIVDDDARLRAFVAEELGGEGYAVREAGSGMAGLEAARPGEVDLVLLDWTLPDLSGVEVCRRLRARGLGLPVLMLSGRDAVSDRVEALDAGADDYLVKPFSIDELRARLRARLRRHAESEPEQGDLLRVEDLSVDLPGRAVRRGAREIQLTAREFDLLVLLARNPYQVQSRQSLLEGVWGQPFIGDANVLDVYIRYLRRKIEAPGEEKLIHTVRGVGFVLKRGEPLAQTEGSSS